MNNDDIAPLSDRVAIIQKLSILVKNKCTIITNVADEDSSIIIRFIDENDGSLIFILSCGTWEQDVFYKKMALAPRVEFSAVFHDAQVTFTSKGIRKITHKGEAAFIMDIPNTLHWQNRRRHYRKKIPIVNSSFCEVILPIPSKDSTDEYKENYTVATTKAKQKLVKHPIAPSEVVINLIRLSLYDVSLSGCSILNYDEEFSYFLSPKMIYEDCKIIKPDGSEIKMSFEIMMKRRIEIDEDEFNELIGIKFLGIQRDD